jgi:hypothetical protein
MNKDFIYKYRYVIGGAIALAIAGIVIYKTRNSKKEDASKEDFMLGNTTSTEGELIFSMPVTKFSEYSVVVVFGGISYATPTWVMNQVPKELLSKALFVFAPYTMTYSTVTQRINDFVAKNKILVKNTSLIGFSAGGLNVQRAYNKNFKFIGLIDPSTKKENLATSYGDNVKMVYNDANWGGFPQVKAVLPSLADLVNKVGGSAEKVNLKHDKMPSYFFDKYKNEIA